MPKLADIAKAANDYYLSGKFIPDIRPGCANFVSHCMENAGGPSIIVSYVPYLVDKCEKVPPTKVETGMPVVFERTYDAVSPDGIGPEDDMTHIGILIIEPDGLYFIDYGGSPAKVRKQKLEGWWLDRVQFCLKPPGFESAQDSGSSGNSPETPDSSKTIKLFTNKNGKTIIADGKKENINSMAMILTGKTNSLTVDMNPLNDYPCLFLNGKWHKVTSMETVIKCEEVQL